MKKIIYTLLFLSFSWSQGGILIISDIDDTIRQTNVLSRARMVRSVLKPTPAFPALREIFNHFSHLENNFYYLSAAPKCIARYDVWIKKVKLPKGKVYQRPCDVSWLRQDYTAEYKFKALVEIIKANNPSQIILFGDNAEHDPVVYQKIKKEFSHLEIDIYIRDIRVEATNIDKDLSVKKLEGVKYFLTEYDLISDAIFVNLPEDQKNKIKEDFKLGKLYPEYLYANLARRYKEELGLSPKNADVRAFDALTDILQ